MSLVWLNSFFNESTLRDCATKMRQKRQTLQVHFQDQLDQFILLLHLHHLVLLHLDKQGHFQIPLDMVDIQKVDIQNFKKEFLHILTIRKFNQKYQTPKHIIVQLLAKAKAYPIITQTTHHPPLTFKCLRGDLYSSVIHHWNHQLKPNSFPLSSILLFDYDFSQSDNLNFSLFFQFKICLYRA